MSNRFEDIVDRSELYSRKWERMNGRMAKSGELIPPFSVADTDFKHPDVMIEKFNEYTQEMIFGYSRPGDEYYNSFINWVSRRHGFNIKREWIVDGNGVVPAIYTGIRAFSNVGDGVIIMTPVYPPFKNSIVDTKREVINCPLVNNDNEFTMDLQLLEELAKVDTNKILIMCNPHNPVGRVWSKDELLEVARICNEHDVLVISDEIHMDLMVGDHKHIMYSSLNDAALNNSIILTSASKSFNIAGSQTSMSIIANEDLRKAFEVELALSPFFGINVFGFKLTEIAYNYCEDWFDELLQLITDNHHYLYDFVNNEVDGVTAVKLEGSYLQWLDFKGLNMSDEALFDFLVDDCSLFLTAGDGYGEGGSQYLRWNIATPTHIMKAGLERLKDAVKAK